MDHAWSKLPDWADQFGFKIRDETVVFGQGDVNRFIDELDSQFADWSAVTKESSGKL